MKTSATGGFLQPINNVIEGQSYEELMQQFLCGITGFSEQLMIPQKKLALVTRPESGTEWISFFLQHHVAADSPYLKNISHDEVIVQRVFTDTWLITFHGPLHAVNCEHFEDAVHIYQNRDGLRKVGISVKSVCIRNQGLQIASADFNHDQTEVQLVLNREVKRFYKILDFNNSVIPIAKS